MLTNRLQFHSIGMADALRRVENFQRDEIALGIVVKNDAGLVLVTFGDDRPLLQNKSQGICALICEVIWFDGSSGCTKSIGALALFESLEKVTLTLPRVTESGMVAAEATLLASELPKIEINEPGVIACPP